LDFIEFNQLIECDELKLANSMTVSHHHHHHHHQVIPPTTQTHTLPRAHEMQTIRVCVNVPRRTTSTTPRRSTTSSSAARRNAHVLCAASKGPNANETSTTDDDDDDFLRFLEDSMDGKSTGASATDGLNWGGDMTGDELRNMVLKRYGKLYDARICQRRDRFNKLQVYLQIMWKFLGQKSFPLSEAEYIEQTDAVAEVLTEWGVGDVVRTELPRWPKFPRMDTTGANAVMIPLGLEDLEEGIPGVGDD
jgi:hypothetical protein